MSPRMKVAYPSRTRRIHSAHDCRSKNRYTCARCGKLTCAECQGTSDRPNLCDWCWSNAADLHDLIDEVLVPAIREALDWLETAFRDIYGDDPGAQSLRAMLRAAAKQAKQGAR